MQKWGEQSEFQQIYSKRPEYTGEHQSCSVIFCPEIQLYLLEMEFFLRLTNDRMKGQQGSLFVKQVFPSPRKVCLSVLMSVHILHEKESGSIKKCTRGRLGVYRRNCDYMLLQRQTIQRITRSSKILERNLNHLTSRILLEVSGDVQLNKSGKNRSL